MTQMVRRKVRFPEGTKMCRFVFVPETLMPFVGLPRRMRYVPFQSCLHLLNVQDHQKRSVMYDTPLDGLEQEK